MTIMAKSERKSNGIGTTKSHDPIEVVAIDSALNMFRDMLLDEYTRRFKAGDKPGEIKAVLSRTGIRFEVLFKDMPKDKELLVDRVNNELSYISRNYYELFALYKELSATLNIVYTYSGPISGEQYKDKARKYLDAISGLKPDKQYDEQMGLQRAAIDALKSVNDCPDIIRIGRRDEKELDTRNVLLNISLIELDRLEQELSLTTGYIDTYKEILTKTLTALNLSLKKRAV
ncbi:hypothetical protein M1578_00875 [Candidatus Marsarchaeota archaeon]|nr:hypothetical protein [Candidatus Marsarchaeota archaeon]